MDKDKLLGDAFKHLQKSEMVYNDELDVLNESLNDFLKKKILGICRDVNRKIVEGI